METNEIKTVVSTIPLNSGNELVNTLVKSGINAISLPMIKIVQLRPNKVLEKTILNLSEFTIIVFTSRNGVSSFFKTLKSITGTYFIPDTIKIAAIGESTANELTSYKHKTEYISKINSAVGLSGYLKEEVITKGDKILLVLGKLAPDFLEKELKKIAYTKRVDVYDTVMPDFIDNKVIDQVKKNDADLILFSSPSAFDNFISVSGINPRGLNIPIATIGDTTAVHIRKKGYLVKLVASKPDYNIFANEIINFFNK